MISDVRNSLNNLFYERLTSPFYGALFISWLIWNWQIIYLTFVIGSDEIEVNKIDYIISNYSNIWNLLYFPLISTLVIITIIPFITNGAYYLSLLFNSWKVEKRNNVEKKQLLTVEQSIQLREQISNQEQRFNSLLTEKNEKIKQLDIYIDQLETENSKKNASVERASEENANEKKLETKSGLRTDLFLAKKIIYNPKLKEAQEILSQKLDKNKLIAIPDLLNIVDSESITFFEINDLIKNSNDLYYWTSLGKEVNKIVFNEKFG